MKKFIIIGIILIFIVFIAIVGSILVTPNNKIKKIDDIMVVQKKLEKDYSCYGYTIDNPKVVVNPYKIAPLSALIMFETKDKVKIGVYFIDKSGNKNKLYEEEKETKEHYLDIYGMLSNDENKVVLMYKGIDYEQKINIKLDNNINVENDIDIEDNKIKFLNYNKDLVGINKDREVLYYFKGYNNGVKQLVNGHLLVTSSRVNNDGDSVGFSEIDLVGRIYNDYIIKDGYKNIVYVMENGNYLVASDDVLEIDKQNGKVIKRFKVNDEVLDISYSKDDNYVIVKLKDKELYFDYNKAKLVQEKDARNDINIDNSFNINMGNYFNKFKQNRFSNYNKTRTVESNMNLLINKKHDKVYKDCDIKYKQEFDRIVVSKKCDKDVYVVLDKFMDKKIYKINNKEFYINNYGLKGEYIIYVKISDGVYKSGYYVKI